MKKVISEQQVLRLPYDKKWEYAAINGKWHARKIGTTDWKFIDIGAPGVVNTLAIDRLNKQFPNAVQDSLKTGGQTTQQTSTDKLSTDSLKQLPTNIKQRQPQTHEFPKNRLPTDFSKPIRFYFPDNSNLILQPNLSETSKKILNLTNIENSLGNDIVLPKDTALRYCKNNYNVYIFTKPSEELNQICLRDNVPQNYLNSIGVINLKRQQVTYNAGTVGESKLKSIIKKVLQEQTQPKLKLTQDIEVSENLKFHIDRNISLSENVFRIYSEAYFDLINEVRNLYEKGLIKLTEDDVWMVESDLGKKIMLENGEEVYLDAPIYEDELYEIIVEAKHRGKNVKLNSPFRTPGGPKKFAVYVKTPKGTIKKVTFGDPNLRVRNTNKKAAKSFRARHKCDQKKDRTTAGYWSCNVSRYRKKLGLKSSRTW